MACSKAKTFEPDQDIADLPGKVYFVTGGIHCVPQLRFRPLIDIIINTSKNR